MTISQQMLELIEDLESAAFDFGLRASCNNESLESLNIAHERTRKARKVLSEQIRMLEDAIVIYRIT